MEYLKPTLSLLGPVSTVVLGTGSSPDPDGVDEGNTGFKPLDIVAGLDD